MDDWQVPLAAFEAALASGGQPFWTGLEHGTMRVLLFAPQSQDQQAPHPQDEIYIILRGTADFVKEGERRPVKPGDVLFVAAGAVHRFNAMTTDFATWVVFWGPVGGEH